eukprot:gene16907-20090_t
MRERRRRADGITSTYLFTIDSQRMVDATDAGVSSRCAHMVLEASTEHPVIVFFSIREIAVGEEITYDYKHAKETTK